MRRPTFNISRFIIEYKVLKRDTVYFGNTPLNVRDATTKSYETTWPLLEMRINNT